MPRSRLPRIQSLTDGSFEPSKRNGVSLRDDESLSDDFKQIRIGETNSVLSLSKNSIKIDGDLNLTGYLSNGKIETDDTYLDFISANGYFRFHTPTTTAGQEPLLTISGGSVLWSSVGDYNIASEADIDMRAEGDDFHFRGSNDNAVDFFFHFDASNYSSLTVAANGATTLATIDADGTVGHLTLDVDGDIELNADGGDIYFKDAGTIGAAIEMGVANTLYVYNPLDSGDFFKISTIANGATTISTLDDSATAAHLTLDIDGSLITDPADGKYIAKNNGTEFSATDSAYAGMILGYTCLRNLDTTSGKELITIGTSMTVLQTDQGNDVKVTFVAPPSGKVEIVFAALVDASSKTIRFALSDNATFNELAAIQTYDNKCVTIDESDEYVNNIRWCVEGLTEGSSYTFFVAAKSSSASSYIYQGINRFNTHSPPIIVKAIALPATIYSGE
tara:strand:+ start:1981 stop:3324 length:1344 start_codon:yes stop_codon:yes gene_type:complete